MAEKFAIVDLETTGGSVEGGKVTEVAVVLFDGEKILETFDTLVNPERSIPPPITRLTGITNEMVKDAPKFFEIAKRLVEMTENAVFVAHNVDFDYGFLRKEYASLGYTFSRKKLCTVRLCRKAFPGLKSYSLGNLIRHFDIPVRQRHRALDDALATTELLRRALATTHGKKETRLLINHGIKASRLPKGIPLEFLHSIPEETGVYFMHDSDGEVLYIGKAVNIRKRIMQHFADNSSKGRLIHDYVADITWELTGSELAALLLESAEIKRLQPKLNRTLRRKLLPFALWAYTDTEGYLCFESGKLTRTLAKKNNLTILADFPKKSHARKKLHYVVENFELCTYKAGVSKVQKPCFNYHIQKCYGACTGEESPESYNERAAMAMEYLRKITTESFAILDKGRQNGEQTVVLVENGRYKGFGYVSDDRPPVTSIEEVRDLITPAAHHQDALVIIQHWIAGNEEKVVFL